VAPLIVTDPGALPPSGAVEALAPAAWAATRPDLHLVLAPDGATRARLSVWHARPVPVPPGTFAGDPPTAAVVGHAAWTDPADGAVLLAHARQLLADLGATHVVGPMDGSTWHAYRVVTDAAPSGGATEPPFAMEPAPPPAVAEAFAADGFAPVARYLSARVDTLADESARVAERRRLFASRGLTFVPADDLGAALDDIYVISVAAFASNAFYTPLPRDAFLATYRPLLPHVDPRLVRFARDADGRAVAFAFGVPDLAQAARGEAVDTVIVKTIAVDPARRAAGAGSALVGELHEAARLAGYRRAIHALMHEANASTRISAHTARPMRRYALLGRMVGTGRGAKGEGWGPSQAGERADLLAPRPSPLAP